jgi:murein endopeptidase
LKHGLFAKKKVETWGSYYKLLPQFCYYKKEQKKMIKRLRDEHGVLKEDRAWMSKLVPYYFTRAFIHVQSANTGGKCV